MTCIIFLKFHGEFLLHWKHDNSVSQRDSLKNKNRWNSHIQTTPLNCQARQRRGRRDWNISREAGAPNHGYLLNALKTLFRLSESTFKSLEMHSKRRYKSCICSVVLGQIESFRNHLGPQHYFPENFRCNFRFYESANFSDSSLHRIF